jgi:sugar O-acyltransferase (sialic acid O-acetyltransferase NeuD family)
MKKLVILGASGHGKVVADTAWQCGWQDIHFYDDTWPDKQHIAHWPIIGNATTLLQQSTNYTGILIAIGDNPIRLDKTRQIQQAQHPLATLTHPTAYLSSDTTLGTGSIVCAGAIVQPGTTIGIASIINTNASIDHDCHLADGVHISPGAHLAGNIHIGENSWIGIGVSIKHNITIGANVTIGAGAAVITDIPDNTLVAGVPARPI